jgi:hydroxyethylthiazole kinase-like uncharacterized protein yjeF
MKLVTVAEMQAIERKADASGITYDQMMEHAGQGVGQALNSAYSQYRHDGVIGLVGPGNNGGDTLVALTFLANHGWRACAYLVRSRIEHDPLVDRLRKMGGQIYSIDRDQDYSVLKYKLEHHKVILDGVFGTGIKLPLRGKVSEVLSLTKGIIQSADDAKIVVAVDCPSGIDCDSGEAAPEVLAADLTVTMAAVKTGLLKFPAAKFVGEIVVAGIGLSDQDSIWEPIRRFVVTDEWVKTRLPKRPIDAHKGTFGTSMIVAGSLNYSGAALLAGKAAYLCGAGLVTLAVPEPLHAALAGHFPEATWVLLPHLNGAIAQNASDVLLENLDRVTSMLVGPGFGLAKTTQEFMRFLFPSEKTMQPKSGGVSSKPISLPPVVIDADGLKMVSQLPEWSRRIPSLTILTPHPGEMSVMSSLPVNEIQSHRLEIAEKYAQLWGQILVLKGANTIVASPDGRTAIIPIATPALARAGSGDVLSGLITGLRTQGIESFEAATMGTWIHGKAGLYVSQEIGSSASVLAGDIIEGIKQVMNNLTHI